MAFDVVELTMDAFSITESSTVLSALTDELVIVDGSTNDLFTKLFVRLDRIIDEFSTFVPFTFDWVMLDFWIVELSVIDLFKFEPDAVLLMTVELSTWL